MFNHPDSCSEHEPGYDDWTMACPGCIDDAKKLLTIKDQHIAELEKRVDVLEGHVIGIIRENCPACDDGVFEIQENFTYDEDGEVDGIEINEIECQYCGEIIEALKGE